MKYKLCQRNLTQKLMTWCLLTCQELNLPVSQYHSEQKVWCQIGLYALGIKEIAQKKFEHKKIILPSWVADYGMIFHICSSKRQHATKWAHEWFIWAISTDVSGWGPLFVLQVRGKWVVNICATFSCSIAAHTAGSTRLPLPFCFKTFTEKILQMSPASPTKW